MAAKKDDVRAERGFIKKANDCSNCAFYDKPVQYEPATCLKDDFKVMASSWCNNHKRKESK